MIRAQQPETRTLFVLPVLPDDLYAYALSKTLTKVSSPATVGLYSSCHNRIAMILGQMRGMTTFGFSQRVL